MTELPLPEGEGRGEGLGTGFRASVVMLLPDSLFSQLESSDGNNPAEDVALVPEELPRLCHAHIVSRGATVNSRIAEPSLHALPATHRVQRPR